MCKGILEMVRFNRTSFPNPVDERMFTEEGTGI